MNPDTKNEISQLCRYFLPYQRAWVLDPSPLKLMEKSRQVGISYADAYRSVRRASRTTTRHDLFVSSRDQFQAKLYIDDCKRWAEVLHIVIQDLGEVLLDPKTNGSAFAIQFANGHRIYSLSSDPNALAGKHGDVVLDEFALHADQRLLYRVAKPVTTWGGTLTIISTHRGVGTLFNQFIRDIREHGNPMGWSLHSITLHTAVDQGLVERINYKATATDPTHAPETRQHFLDRTRSECVDEEQWLQEYCCTPADESAVFISHDMLDACEDRNNSLMTPEALRQYIQFQLARGQSPALYAGVDVARTKHLAVIYVSEKIGDVMWDRCRIELQNRPTTDLESQLFQFLTLPQLKRACIDATGMGIPILDRARQRFGYKVEGVTFTPAVKEDLAFHLRAAFEERKLRLVRDENLRADLRGLRKQVTSAGNIRFDGEAPDSHCDRTWALALCLHAARTRFSAGGLVG